MALSEQGFEELGGTFAVIKVSIEFTISQNLLGHHLELVSKELNHLAAILHVYAGGLNFMK